MTGSGMSRIAAGLLLAVSGVAGLYGQDQVKPLAESGFQSIFDGKSMAGWDGDTDFWRVENGELVGETRPDHQPKQNTFLIWRGGKPADFELRMQYKLTGAEANSGLQYRSVEMPEVAKWVLKGYQADMDVAQRYTGQLYEERNRGFLANRGQISYISDGAKPGSIGSTGTDAALKEAIKADDWNDLQIIARGNTLIHIINGKVMSVFIDDDKGNRKADGVLGIQLHVTKAAMKMEVKNVRIKQF